MRPQILLAALALIEFGAAGPCKPSSRSTVSSSFLTSSVPTADPVETSTTVQNDKTTVKSRSETTISLSTTLSTETTTEASSSQTIIDSNTVTSLLPSTDVPSLTVAHSTTATEEEFTIITNAIEGGSFASRDPNSPSGLTNFKAEGNAEFHSGGCYKGDNSQDDGCAALTASGDPGSKRSLFGRMARIYQTVKSVPRRKNTIQFFYHLTSGGDCTVAARFGGSMFWSAAASTDAGSWVKVIGQVEALDGSPIFDVSLTCNGAGSSSILVDSIFISDKVTPDTIGSVQLDFGSAPVSILTTAIESASRSAQTSGSQNGNTAKAISTTSRNEPILGSSTEDNDAPTSKTTSAQPAELTGCSATCTLIEDYQQPYDDFGCNLNGVFTNTNAIYGFGSDDNPNMQFYARDVEQCSEFCKIQFPGCKSVGFQKLSGRCFFSNTLVTREEIRDGRDSQMVDWYNINKCFECRMDCGEEAPPVQIISTEVHKPTTTARVLSTTTNQVPSKTEPTESAESTCSPTCQRVDDFTWHTEDWSCGLYGAASGDIYTLPADIPGDTLRYENVNECGAICKTLPGCKSAGYQPASMRCFYSNSVVTEVTQASDSQCAGCGFDDPDPHETTITEASTSDIPSTTHESSTFVTTTRASQSTGVCYNNRGQQCEISHSSVENNPYVCITAGVFLGQSWTEPRSKYPIQESQEGCAAICDTLPNCETSAFFGSENHCLFTSTKVTEADFAEPDPDYEEPGFDPKNAVWSHRSCYTCPNCVPSNDPLPKSPTCNYKAGDSCTRTDNSNAVCNFSGVLKNNFYQYGSSLYPAVNQDTAAKCAAICRTRKDCMGSASIGGSCYFTYQAMTADSFRQIQGITHVWDDPSCWDCPGCHT
ncbi:uncharacterized protein B0J16DRAFT_310488 [Fusarium flagelliforme]|uniref:uncharacterized protein n=1 Tax=Fusarium flagelliforme TaxID=2675880 RepID=UPI001E8D1A73|nr:uncharacterized protein B0J16DRAFT_310488 [Fusarium flagelliforme]KAH7174919.1 hypothetical protein B0J16DRAFT_310488 [Fusarium flagelliforme]